MTSDVWWSRPEWWMAVYAVQLLLLSLALGSLTLHWPRGLMLPRFPRFVIGFCLAPFAVAAWMLAAAVIAPGASRWLLLLPPPVAAAALLARYGMGMLRRLGRFYRRCRRQARTGWPVYAAYLCAALLVAQAGVKLAANAAVPVSGSDALQYLGYALKLAQERSASAITGFHDPPDGVAVGDMHGPVWHAYLQHALMTNGRHPPGYPHDHAVRAAFQVTVIYLLLAVAALAAAGYPGTTPLALALLLGVPQYEYISIGSSRDGFRIIPLVLLAAILAGLSARSMRRHFRPAALLPVGAMAALALAGHSLGGLVVACIGLAWAIWVLVEKASWRHVVLVGMAMGAGLVLAGPQYLQAYCELGRVPGTDVFHKMAIDGTPMLAAWNHWMASRLEGAEGVIGRLSVFLARDHYRLSVLGALGGVGAIALWPALTRRRRASVMAFVGLVTLAAALPFTGLLDIGFDLSLWFVRNLRYALHWYPFAAVCVAMLLGYGYDRLMSGAGRYSRILAQAGLCAVILAASFSASRVIAVQWRTGDGSEPNSRLAPIRPLAAALQQLAPGKKLLLDNDSDNYYLNNQAIVMYSRPTWRVIQAQDEHQAWQALQALNVGAVGLKFAPQTGAWKNMALLEALSNPDRARRLPGFSTSSLKVFVLNGALSDRRRQDLEASLAAALGSLRSSWSFESLPATGDGAEIVARTGQGRARLEGAARLVPGPFSGTQALWIEGMSRPMTRVLIPPDALRLQEGSLSVWARLADPTKTFSDLVAVHAGPPPYSSTTFRLYIYHQADGALMAGYNGKMEGPSSISVADDQWHHYAATWKNGEQKLYIDGCDAVTGSAPADAQTASEIALGWIGYAQETEHWHGAMAELMTFDRALEDHEIAALYLAGSDAKKRHGSMVHG